MFDKYIKNEVEKYRVKQNSDGTWICSDLKANTIPELDCCIGYVNSILNKYNNETQENEPVKKTKKPQVKGLE